MTDATVFPRLFNNMNEIQALWADLAWIKYEHIIICQCVIVKQSSILKGVFLFLLAFY